MRPGVTLLIPTCNAGPEFPEILARMRAQELDRSFEILAIDSESTDGTREFLRRQALRLLEIRRRDFNHGLTRNLGIREAAGEIVVLATQDARPADARWMQALVDCFDDPAVAGAYSRQVPRPDATPFMRDRLRTWAAAGAERRVQSVVDAAEFEALAPLEKLERAAFDNVSSSVRRQVALEIPFHARAFGEDLEWGSRVIARGYKIVFEPRSTVVHSHDRSAWYELKRVYLDHQQLHRLFGLHTVPRRRDVLRHALGGAARLCAVVGRDPALSPAAKALWCLRALPFSLAQTLGQFLGARSVAGLERGDRVYRALQRRLARGV